MKKLYNIIVSRRRIITLALFLKVYRYGNYRYDAYTGAQRIYKEQRKRKLLTFNASCLRELAVCKKKKKETKARRYIAKKTERKIAREG